MLINILLKMQKNIFYFILFIIVRIKYKDAQLLLIAIIILAITVILVIGSAAIYINLNPYNREYNNFHLKYEEILTKFGYYLEDMLNKYNDTVGNLNNTTIYRCFNETRYNFSIFFIYQGIDFTPKLIEIQDTTDELVLHTKIKIISRNMILEENIQFIFSKNPVRFRAYK